LQVYNKTSGLWEELDSDSTTAADTTFTLAGSVGVNISDYYDTGNWVSFRIYQELT
jgi:hypothetical protein